MGKILIAEDEPDIRELLKFTLQYAGHEVVAARDGQEAVDMAMAEIPDLILMDARMPRLSGYEACQRIKNDPKLAHILVVFLSAKGQEAEIKTGLEAGAVEYLLKPFAPEELVEHVGTLLRKAGK